MVQIIKSLLTKGGFAALLCILLTACFEREGCEEKYLLVPMHSGYADWFSGFGTNDMPVQKVAKTGSGLQETVTVSRGNNQMPVLKQPDYCTYVSGKTLSMSYHSSMYGNNISVLLAQQKDGELPVLKIYAYSQSSDFQDYTELLHDFNGTHQYPITYSRFSKKASSSTQIPTNAFPEVSVVDSMVAGNRVYRQVYKITNPYLQKEGNTFSITDFYIDKAYGLVQYAQKDGTIWQIQL